jgi:hypothetical protein
MYAARIEATERERDRRVQEVGEKFQPQHEWHPFRLHLVHCPAMEVPLVVRRGERAYPLTLTWLAPHATFVGVRCPGCGAEEPLVAGRSQLGCRSCLARPAPVADPEIALQGKRVTMKASTAPPPVNRAEQPPPAGRAEPPPRPRAATRPREAEGILRRLEAQRLKREAAEMRAQQTRSSVRREHAGDRLSYELWRACALRQRFPERQVMPHTAFAVVQRLFGPLAAQVALGLPVAAIPDSSTSATTHSLGTGAGFTWGTVRTTAGAQHRYLLHWQWFRNQALVSEVLPAGPLDRWDPTANPVLTPTTAPALYGDAPVPPVPLDPVEALLWSTEVARAGLPAVARCFAIWSVMRPALEHVEPATAAAALATVMARHWRRARTASQMSREYGASVQAVGRVVRDLNAFLKPRG